MKRSKYIALCLVFIFALAVSSNVAWCAPQQVSAEAWIKSQLARGGDANLDEFCKEAADPFSDKIDPWNSSCRTVSAGFVSDLIKTMKQSQYLMHLTFRGVKVIGDINLENADINGSVAFFNSIFDGNIVLMRAHSKGYFIIDRSLVRGSINADSLRVESDLFIRNYSRLEGDLLLIFCGIVGNLDLSSSTFVKKFDAYQGKVGSLNASNAHFLEAVDISGMKVAGAISFRAATASNGLNAGNIDAGQDVLFSSDENNTTRIKHLILSQSHLRSSLFFDGAILEDSTEMYEVQIDKSLFAQPVGTQVSKFSELHIEDSDVHNNVQFISINISDSGDLSGLRVGGSIYLSQRGDVKGSIKDLDLSNVKVSRNLELNGNEISGNIVAKSIFVGGDFEMSSSIQSLDLSNSRVTGLLDLTSSNVGGFFKANNVVVGGDVYMSNANGQSSYKNIQLNSSVFNGIFQFNNATIDGHLSMDASRFERGLFLFRSIIAQGVEIRFAKVNVVLSIAGSTMAGCDLAGTNINGQFVLGTPPAVWKSFAGSYRLDLRNVHVQNLVDTESAWPEKGYLNLDGFEFDRLGGSFGDSSTTMISRGMDWWDHWAQLDEKFSPTPYKQLAIIFDASGHREDANKIRYLERAREREAAFQLGDWSRYLLDTLLQIVAGYGIGFYTFRAFGWLLALSMLLAIMLWLTVPDVRTKERGKMWAFGAALSKMLPVVEISEEFKEFFNDPRRDRIGYWVTFASSVAGILGWLIGALVVLAFSNLTLK